MDSKLAPIFEKRSKAEQQVGRKPVPVLSEAEKQALEIRRAFLTSGVPDELKRQKLSSVFPVLDSPMSVVWPTDSHVQQRPVALPDAVVLPGFVDPWTLQSCDLPYRDLVNKEVSPLAALAFGSFTDILQNPSCSRVEVCIIQSINQDAYLPTTRQ